MTPKYTSTSASQISIQHAQRFLAQFRSKIRPGQKNNFPSKRDNASKACYNLVWDISRSQTATRER